eukprot:6202029-Pleurochrysis_carterae.AAC.1
MAAVRAIALVCESSLWMLLMRAIGSDARIVDMMPTMWPTALTFFEQAAASLAAVIDGTLELIVEGVREEKLTARPRRAALDMARIVPRASGCWGFARRAPAVCGLHGDGRCDAQPLG